MAATPSTMLPLGTEAPDFTLLEVRSAGEHVMARIDAAAKKVGKTVLGTGVNPGFLMDSLPLNLTSI